MQKKQKVKNGLKNVEIKKAKSSKRLSSTSLWVFLQLQLMLVLLVQQVPDVFIVDLQIRRAHHVIRDVSRLNVLEDLFERSTHHPSLRGRGLNT